MTSDPGGDASRFYDRFSQAPGKFLLDPRELSVRELCFVVDTIVELRELQYAQQIQIKTPGKLEASVLRGEVRQRADPKRQRYQWPHGGYRLIDVGKKGGICADQAYFASHAGKALGRADRGVPGSGPSRAPMRGSVS